MAYLFSSCFSAQACELYAEELLEYYFGVLAENLANQLPETAITELIDEWRALYPVAWADFYRFLQGWRPGHWKMHAHSERMVRQALQYFSS